ncbi:hypothetical protein ACJX0J_013826, partial [Zea mays]
AVIDDIISEEQSAKKKEKAGVFAWTYLDQGQWMETGGATVSWDHLMLIVLETLSLNLFSILLLIWLKTLQE